MLLELEARLSIIVHLTHTALDLLAAGTAAAPVLPTVRSLAVLRSVHLYLTNHV